MSARPEIFADLPGGARVAVTIRAVDEIEALSKHLLDHWNAIDGEELVLRSLLGRIQTLARAASSALTSESDSAEAIKARTFGDAA